MIAALLAAAYAVPWVPVGVSQSHLHVFVERASVHDASGHRFARIRIGSPGTITGAIVLVYQDEEVDCAASTWRLLAFDARDANGTTVKRSDADHPPSAMMPAVPGTIGGEAVATVCAF